jgi:UPF0042 nucleotide-binding protein
VDSYHGHRIVQHSGGTPGFSSVIYRFVDDGLSVIILTNHADRIVDQMAIDIAGVYVPALRRPTGSPDPDPKTSLRLKDVMRGLLGGKHDPASFTPAMNAFLSTATGKAFWEWFASHGALKSFSFSDHEDWGTLDPAWSTCQTGTAQSPIDIRTGEPSLALAAMRGALEGRGIRPRVVFLEASDDVLIRRFSETRHRHPLGDERGIANSIAEERRRLDAVRSDSDVVLDTSDLSLRQLRERLFAALATDVRPDQLAFQLISFGFKHGVPLEADLVFDVRFMQNPFYVAELRPLSGLTDEVRTFVLDQPVATRFLDFLVEFLEFAIPAYISEGKTRLTIAIGCTGGYHRSIVIAEELASWLRNQDYGPVAVFHRELDRA